MGDVPLLLEEPDADDCRLRTLTALGENMVEKLRVGHGVVGHRMSGFISITGKYKSMPIMEKNLEI
jgi:hypothetical protein